jgi:glutamyl-tRNA synthetase
MQKKIVTRFPPSPTGYLHIGGARTALFNWLFARQNQGKFILRIEDTDEIRSTDEAARAIIESMEWLGLDWDEGPVFQSRRYDLYNSTIDQLLSTGQAYYCHCQPEALDQKRKQALTAGKKPKYDGKCRNLGLGPAPGAVVRLKTPQNGSTEFNDLVKGHIRFDNSELDDLILKRSNGNPTYHLAVVSDDINLGITYVIRGDDHLNNTPRQILIYKALGKPLPEYAHVPMILGPDKTRLSKRHGAMSVLAYKEMGYLPQALLNSLARLGWAYGDQEKFSIDELIENFSLANVGKSAGVFNTEKLLDLNAWHIRNESDQFLAKALPPFLEQLGFKGLERANVMKIVPLLKERSKTLVEMAEKSGFYFENNFAYEKKAAEKFLKPGALDLLKDLLEMFKAMSDFHQTALETAFVNFMEEKGIKLRKIAQPLRVALTGQTVSPGIFEVMDVLRKDEVITRLKKAIDYIHTLET